MRRNNYLCRRGPCHGGHHHGPCRGDHAMIVITLHHIRNAVRVYSRDLHHHDDHDHLLDATHRTQK
jgi:hypothetical protein